MQVQVGGGDRAVLAYRRPDRDRIDAAGQPQAGSRMPKVMNSCWPSAIAAWSERALERGGVQLVTRLGHAQQGIQLAGPWRSSPTIGSTRSATGTRRDLPDLVPLVATPSGSARWTINIGIGSSMNLRTWIAVSPTSADRSYLPGERDRPAADSSPKPVPRVARDRPRRRGSSRSEGRAIGVRESPSPGSRRSAVREPPRRRRTTASSSVRRTDASAKPCRLQPTSTRVISWSVHRRDLHCGEGWGYKPYQRGVGDVRLR